MNLWEGEEASYDPHTTPVSIPLENHVPVYGISNTSFAYIPTAGHYLYYLPPVFYTEGSADLGQCYVGQPVGQIMTAGPYAGPYTIGSQYVNQEPQYNPALTAPQYVPTPAPQYVSIYPMQQTGTYQDPQVSPYQDPQGNPLTPMQPLLTGHDLVEPPHIADSIPCPTTRQQTCTPIPRKKNPLLPLKRTGYYPTPEEGSERKRDNAAPNNHRLTNDRKTKGLIISGCKYIYRINDADKEKEMLKAYQQLFPTKNSTYVMPSLLGSESYFRKHFPPVEMETKDIVQRSAKRAKTLQHTRKWMDIARDELEPVVIYWMSRELRTNHNHGLALAQSKAFVHNCPLIVYINPDTWSAANMRQFSWRVEALVEVVENLAANNIKTICELPNSDFSSFILLQNCFEVQVLITDFYPLNEQLKHEAFALQHVRSTTEVLKCDSHNLVPTWEISPALEERRQLIEAAKRAERMSDDESTMNSSEVPLPQLSETSSSEPSSLDGRESNKVFGIRAPRTLNPRIPWTKTTQDTSSDNSRVKGEKEKQRDNSRSTESTSASSKRVSPFSSLSSKSSLTLPQTDAVVEDSTKVITVTAEEETEAYTGEADATRQKGLDDDFYFKEIPRANMFRRLLTTKLMAYPVSELPAPLISQTKTLRELDPVIFTLENSEDVMCLIHLKYNAVTNNPGIVRVNWLKAGQRAAEERLDLWIKEGLAGYWAGCHDPSANATSLLSSYINHGCISAQYIVYRIETSIGNASDGLDHPETAIKADKEKFNNEIVVWKELSDHFCLYNPDYDTAKCFPSWGSEDQSEREFLYSIDVLEKAQTHDDLWNCCMQELIMFGVMNGQLRLYWAKKIIEWTRDRASALQVSLDLNNKWALDGNDPVGYCATSWAIGGSFDRAFPPLPMYGRVRSITRRGMNRHFDTDSWTEGRTASWKNYIEGSHKNHYLNWNDFKYDKQLFKSYRQSPVYDTLPVISQQTKEKLDDIQYSEFVQSYN